MINKAIHWGILGAGKISYRFAESLKNEASSELVAVALRCEEKAMLFQEKYPCKRVYFEYEALLEDNEIDAIYLALPHGLHKEWAIKALNKKKAVLCEKPAVLNGAEMQEILDIARANNCLFMEAMKSRFVPIFKKIQTLVETDKIGTLQHIDTSQCVEFPFDHLKDSYHTKPNEGGALLDSGIYCASWIEFFTREPLRVNKTYADVRQGIDYYVESFLESAQGVTARLEVSFIQNKPRNATLVGDKGSIEIFDLHRPQKIVVTSQGNEEIIEMPYEHDDFYGEISHFVELLKEGKTESDIMSLDASLHCAEVLDKVRKEFTDYDESCLKILEKQEELLQYDSFSSADALELGQIIARLAQEYHGEVAIQIVRERDETIIFQYIMDSKSSRNLRFMEGKRKAALVSKHASIYPGIEYKVTNKLEPKLSYENGCLPVGGAFPIRVSNEWVATVLVSGLHEGKDHELLVRSLSEHLKILIPDFTKALI